MKQIIGKNLKKKTVKLARRNYKNEKVQQKIYSFFFRFRANWRLIPGNSCTVQRM